MTTTIDSTTAGEIAAAAAAGDPIACPSWCTEHPRGDFHSRTLASDGHGGSVRMVRDARGGGTPSTVQVWIADAFAFELSQASSLECIARMLLDARQGVRGLS